MGIIDYFEEALYKAYDMYHAHERISELCVVMSPVLWFAIKCTPYYRVETNDCPDFGYAFYEGFHARPDYTWPEKDVYAFHIEKVDA